MPHRRCLHRRFGSLCHPDRAPFATLPQPILFSWPFSPTAQPFLAVIQRSEATKDLSSIPLLARAQTARLAPAFFYFPPAAKIASNAAIDPSISSAFVPPLPSPKIAHTT